MANSDSTGRSLSELVKEKGALNQIEFSTCSSKLEKLL
jgi:hypothetical protein